jgi:H/ACA ribonucleoprotein complex subunit 4
MLHKQDGITDSKFGKTPPERSIKEHLRFGVVALDKPPGPGSHLVSEWVKGIVGAKKAGHSGTLDPKVSGVLPIALDNSTKIVGTLLIAGKEYVTVMHVHKLLPEDKIRKTILNFVGKIKQLPPVRSAVKRVLRERKVYSIEILEINGRDVLFKTNVQAGTYIRKLCSDIGKKLGCGAHMAELRRTRAGHFTEKDTVTLHQLSDAVGFWKEDGDETYLRKVVYTVERAVAHLPRVIVKDGAVSAICHGAPLAAVGITDLSEKIKPGETVAIFSLKGELVGIGNALMNSKQIMEATRGFAIKTDRVVMSIDTYPRGWKKSEK